MLEDTGTHTDEMVGHDRPTIAHALKSGDDKELLRAAAKLTSDLKSPDARIFWTDLLLTLAVAYGALAFAMFGNGTAPRIAAAIVAMFAVYRAGSFIHEIAHIKKGDLPWFRFVWNLTVGIPFLAPSFMYEGVHNQHHAKTKYGTKDDPEYLPLANMKAYTLPIFMLGGALAPLLLLFRFAVLAPLSYVSPWLRRHVIGRYSGLQINPDFRREAPVGPAARQLAWQEVGAILWTWSLLAAVFTGVLPLGAFAIFMGVLCAMMAINQLRTMVAHLWENDGEAMTVTAQYLDSVNVPPPAYLPALWAPVGLRYHALHHLLPGLPYHALGEAHRRLVGALDTSSIYHRTSHPGLSPLVTRLAAATWRQR